MSYNERMGKENPDHKEYIEAVCVAFERFSQEIQRMSNLEQDIVGAISIGVSQYEKDHKTDKAEYTVQAGGDPKLLTNALFRASMDSQILRGIIIEVADRLKVTLN